MDRIKKETTYSLRCPKCFDLTTVVFDSDPFNDNDFIYCPRCGEKVER